jgi:hypothetical protein
MIFTFVVGDEKEPTITTLDTIAYNGGGSGRSANHELITTDTPPYE